MSFGTPEFWIGLLQIIGVNIVLSGDNAVVIALAARGLPAAQQKKAIAWGSGAAVVMRIVLTIVAVELLRLPYLKLVGAVLLLWIAVKLLVPGDEAEGHGELSTSLGSAIGTILIADLAMSLDNVIAVAAAAKGDTVLLILGLAISIPVVIFASRLLLAVMERFPQVITVGAGLLGWVAGEMLMTDVATAAWLEAGTGFPDQLAPAAAASGAASTRWIGAYAEMLHFIVPAAAAVGVVLFGRWLAARAELAARKPMPAVAPHEPSQLQRVLLAVDGSEHAASAVRHVLAMRASLRDPRGLDVHLINVQRPVSGDVATFVASAALDDYHHERSEQAMAPARALLAAAGVTAREHRRVGQPGPAIAEVAQAEDCDLVVMGTRGLGSYTGALLGSVAQSTVESSAVPVVLVK
jgi:YjbE family integral membrane protein